MYDYINGEQVKVFYTPIFGKLMSENYSTWHSGGSLSDYKTGDEVPIKTLYYK